MDRDEMRIFGRIEKHLDDIAKSLHNLERLKRVETMKRSEEKPKVAYICDGQACSRKSCDRGCQHTTDIAHAMNFYRVGDNKYMEKETVDKNSN